MLEDGQMIAEEDVLAERITLPKSAGAMFY